MPAFVPTILADLTFDNIDPPWFWALVAVGSIAILCLTYKGIFRRSGRQLTWLLLALRIVGVLALLVALVKPAWTQLIQRQERPQVAIVIDDSQSMSIMHKPAGSEQWTSRYQLAKQWLADSPAGKSLRELFEVKVFNIAGQLVDPAKMAAEPTAEQTDLVRAVRAASGQLRGQSLAGVVLISDGRDTTGRESYLPLQELPAPVYALGFRQPPPGKGAPFDLAVNAVEAPQRVLVHNAVPVKILVSKDSGEAMEIPIQIERAGTPLLTQRVQLPAGASQKMVNLSFTPTEAGDFTLSAHIPEQPNERSGANNARLFKLRVEAEPIRVLYIEGFLRPEYTFLRNRLSNDPDVNLVSFVRSANPDQSGSAGALAGAELITAERLKKIDVVLLGDFESRMLDEPTYAALRQWVEDGGAMMVLGGYYNLGDDGLVSTPLKDALPVELSAGPVYQVEEPFLLRLTDEGKRHPALYITGDATRDAALWESLPPLRGIAAVRDAKPGATVLARHPHPNTDAADKLGYIVLATQHFGKGTVALFTADTTWRWSRYLRLAGKPDTLYVRFWSQMVRWLARRDIQDPRPALAVSTDNAVYERGHKVTVRVQRNLAAMVPGQENQASQLSLVVHTPDGRTTPLSPSPTADPNQWSATYFPDRGGRFEVHARLVANAAPAAPEADPAKPPAGASGSASGSKDLANQVCEFLVHGSSLELDDPATNPSVLEQIASVTGGLYADIDDARAGKDLFSALPHEPRTVTETKKANVWNSPFLLILFLTCISAEWIIRRRNQLV
ncbi:MAG: glutamine amidotransferase [Planctomycetota bacterium]|nr:glutamine amidotransferase [Planctomycetota bacterium]